ncbi:MAG: CDP-alcohol phosphatidyltransferase family protein [Elusimicrobia bacterium]|nr:CDP-alcohol phosphatidyltransferase family protein [Elusimicrobiota bacterium]
MITDAILWVSNPAILLQRAGGIGVLERQLHTLSRAGLFRVWISTDQPAQAAADLRLPAGLELHWSSRSIGGPSAQCKPPYLVVSGSHFIRVETLTHIARQPGGAHTAYLDDHQASVVQIVPARGEEVSPCRNLPLPAGASVALQHPIQDAATVDWLLATGTKSEDGFMARHFDRYISLTITRSLLAAPISPNMMTVLSSLVGLAGTACFLIHAWGAHMAGAGLVWLHSVLDGCDGELARIRFQESRLGSDIDFWGDNLVHVCLFGCLALGFARADHSLLPLLAGAVAAAGIAGSAVLVFQQRLARRRSPAPREDPAQGSLLARIETALEQRDFIYLLLVLAYFGRTYEFMWAGAVGVILFFSLTLYLGRADRKRRVQNEQTFQPYRAG